MTNRPKLTRAEVEKLLEEARASFPHDECLTCECFLGYLTQLGIDAGEEPSLYIPPP